MRVPGLSRLIAWGLLAAAPALAQTSGVPLLDPAAAWRPQFPPDLAVLTPPSGATVATPLLITVEKGDPKPWRAALYAPLSSALQEGDVVRLSFRMRTLGTTLPDGRGRVMVKVQHDRAPFPGAASREFQAGTDWTECRAVFRARVPVPDREGALCLFVAFGAQTVEVRDLRLERFARDADLTPLQTEPLPPR